MPLKVRVQFYSQLRHVAGRQTLDVDLADDATVADLLENVYDRIPALRAHDKTVLVGAGVEFVGRDYKLNVGDEIAYTIHDIEDGLMHHLMDEPAMQASVLWREAASLWRRRFPDAPTPTPRSVPRRLGQWAPGPTVR